MHDHPDDFSTTRRYLRKIDMFGNKTPRIPLRDVAEFPRAPGSVTGHFVEARVCELDPNVPSPSK